jgi:hypothetical protein
MQVQKNISDPPFERSQLNNCRSTSRLYQTSKNENEVSPSSALIIYNILCV